MLKLQKRIIWREETTMTYRVAGGRSPHPGADGEGGETRRTADEADYH